MSNDTSSPSLSEPEEIREYLKSNMAEGYLSEDEGLNIDKFVDEYVSLLETKQNLEPVIRKVFEEQVK